MTYDEDKTPVETPNAKKSSGQWRFNINSNLVPCPDLPCNETCLWCYGSGQIAKSTKVYYDMWKTQQRDTAPSLAEYK